MDAFIQNIAESTTQVQALVVTAGGLIGVFATLTVFYILIRIANSIGEKSKTPEGTGGQ
jgi:hypothetical protein